MLRVLEADPLTKISRVAPAACHLGQVGCLWKLDGSEPRRQGGSRDFDQGHKCLPHWHSVCRAFRVRSEGGLRLLQSGGSASQEVHVGRQEANWAGHHLPILERVARHCRQDFDGHLGMLEKRGHEGESSTMDRPDDDVGEARGGTIRCQMPGSCCENRGAKKNSRPEAEAKLRGGGGTFRSSLIRQCRFNNCFSAAAIHNSPTDDGVAVMQRPAVKLPPGREARGGSQGFKGPPSSPAPPRRPEPVLVADGLGAGRGGRRGRDRGCREMDGPISAIFCHPDSEPLTPISEGDQSITGQNQIDARQFLDADVSLPPRPVRLCRLPSQ